MQEDNHQLPEDVIRAYQNEPMMQSYPDSQSQETSHSELPPIAPEGSVNLPGTVYTGLSGNEMFCLDRIGYKPGNIVVGNSVVAIGIIGGEIAGIKSVLGGEIKQITNMIAKGRVEAIKDLEEEIGQNQGNGATGVTSELIFHPGNIEFLSIGSTIHRSDGKLTPSITSSSDGQEFYCQVDAGYMPIKFVFGNVAYSIGIGKNIVGEFKEMFKGEITQYSGIFNTTRYIALQRIIDAAKAAGANSVVGIKTTVVPIGKNGVEEMVMVGTASYNEQLASLAEACGGVITSDLTAEETWNITKLGYAPMKLILGTSVFSLGVVGNIKAALRSLVHGEVNTLTQLLYQAREESFKRVKEQADEIGADDVLGIKTYIYHLDNNLVEFLTIGTATKRVPGLVTKSDQILPQALIKDKNTFIDLTGKSLNTNLTTTGVGNLRSNNV